MQADHDDAMGGKRGRKVAGWIPVGVFLLLLSMQVSAEGASTAAPALVSELRNIATSLDQMSTRSAANAAAKARLDELQRQHPGVPEVYRELARYYLIVGYQRRDLVEPAHLEAAAQALDKALALRPDYAEAWIARADAHRLQGNQDLAYAALDRAERIGTGSPWLAIYRADLLLDARRYDEALVLLREVQARQLDAEALAATRQDMIRAFVATGRNKEADRLHRDIITQSPQSAWARGNYAGFLLCAMDDEDAALKQVEDARHIADYGLARLTQAAALYRRWTRHVLAGDAKKADESWAEAAAFMDIDPAIAIQGTCRGRDAVRAALEAMRATGRGTRTPAMVGVMMAAEHAPDPVPGLFVLPVRSVGGNRGDVFLGSEEDYRDQRNLSVRITPDARKELARQMGSESLEGFKGMTVEVLGWASRVRIDFRENGVPTGKFYYQTHVVVTQADQIVVRENRPAL